MEKTNELDELCRILIGSKEYKFEYGDYGMSVLKLTNYNTGAKIKLDLGLLVEKYPEVVEEIIIKNEE